MPDILLTAMHGAVLTLTLNRPERLNALETGLMQALNTAFDAAAADPAVRAVLLTGAGRGFCAGADLTQDFGTAKPDLGAKIDAEYNPLVKKMRALPKPILCAVNGVAAGAGMNLALAADIVIAAQSAHFTQAFVRIGLLPDAGGTYFLPRLAGEGRARALALLGETISAAEAQAIGLVWKIFADEVLATEALTMAQHLAARPARALRAIKAALETSLEHSLDAQLNLERDLQRELGYGVDFIEGVMAFREKRPPVFRDRL